MQFYFESAIHGSLFIFRKQISKRDESRILEPTNITNKYHLPQFTQVEFHNWFMLWFMIGKEIRFDKQGQIL